MQALVNQVNQINLTGPSHHHLHYGAANTVPAASRHQQQFDYIYSDGSEEEADSEG